MVSKKIQIIVDANPGIHNDVLKAECNKRSKISVNDLTLYRTRLQASHNSMDDHSGNFKKLRNYYNVLLQTNPGSMAIVKCQES